MAEDQTDREEETRRLLRDAVEVQLAGLRAGISFWSEWIERTTEFVQEATRTLSRIDGEDHEAKDALLELVDAGRASVRGLTEIPRHTAARFIEELDRFEEKKKQAEAEKKKTAPAKSAKKPAKKKAAAKKTRKRAAKVKA